MFHIIKPGMTFDFVGKRHIYLTLSALLVIGTIVLFFTKGINYGIDFTGGAEVHVKIPTNQWDISKVRSELTIAGIKGLKVQQIGDPAESSEFLIRAQGDSKSLGQISERVSAVFLKEFSKTEYLVLRADVVGPAAGAELRKKGMLAMFYALLVILIYVGVRFDSRYAPGAVMALFHDSFIVIGLFILLDKQFDLTILAALLALVGYSNNDTIIVFDRVRETLYNHPEYSIEQGVNRAINETVGRTIVTSLTTFFVAFSLWKFGGSVIENFAFTLMVGVVVGTYSSVFIASSLVISMTNYYKNRDNKHRNNPSKKKKKSYNVRSEPKLQA